MAHNKNTSQKLLVQWIDDGLPSCIEHIKNTENQKALFQLMVHLQYKLSRIKLSRYLRLWLMNNDLELLELSNGMFLLHSVNQKKFRVKTGSIGECIYVYVRYLNS